MLDHLKIVLKLITFFIEFVRRLNLKKEMVRLKPTGGYLEWVFAVEFGDLDF